MSLEMLGISKGLLTLAIINLSILLVLLFAFIFVGIEAFALGGAMGSIINSILPMGKNNLLILKLSELVLEEVRKISLIN